MNSTSCATALTRHSLPSAISILFVIVAGCSGGGGDSTSAGTPSQPVVTPPPPAITLVAGALGGPGNVDGPAARFYQPNGVAVDASGNIYVADTQNHTVRKITSTGVITLAGLANNSGAVDGIGSAARFDMPMGIAVDQAGNVYVSEIYAHTVRKISPAGLVTTLAGAASQRGYVDGVGTAARFSFLAGLAVDPAGNLYVADTGNIAVRRISPSGVVSTVAVAGPFPAPGVSYSGIGNPTGVAVGPTGIVYVVGGVGTVNAISTNGEVAILAGGGGGLPPAGRVDGVGGAARFMSPVAITVDATGNLYVVDKGSQFVTDSSGAYIENGDLTAPIRKVTPQGVVTTLPGSYRIAAGNYSAGIAISGSGNILVSDTEKHAIVSVSQAGLATVVQGSDSQSGATDGTGSAARFNTPKQIAIDSTGNIYVADAGNKVIRKTTANGVVTTLAGKAGIAGQDDGVGAAARFTWISDIKYGIDGFLYATDEGNHLVRRITLDGVVTTVAGRNWPTAVVCAGHVYACGASAPVSLAIDSTGSAFVFDYNFGLRKVPPSGQDVIVDCAGGCYNTGGVAQAMAFDAAGNLYMARVFAITRMSPAGIVTVVAGDPQTPGFTDGSGTSARFSSPGALALDAANNIYVADTRNNAIRKVTPAGVVTTIVGSAGSVGVSLGALPGSLSAPQGIAIERGGTLLVTTENALLRIQP